MSRVHVGGYVEIILVSPDQQPLLHRQGRLVLVTDDVNALVELDDGKPAEVKVDQLKKVG